MKRYPHYWWTLKGARFPTRIAYLDCDGAALADPSRGAVQTERLSLWSLVVTELRAGVPVATARHEGESTGTLWSRIAQLLCSKERTWLYCGPTGRILPMIGFWTRLRAREITLVGRDWRSEDAQSGNSGDSTDGICVLEEPPTVILCQLPGRPGKLLVLDIRNYGIELPLPGKDCRERADYATSGLCDVLRTLRAHGGVSLRCTAASQAVSSLRSYPDCVRLHCHVHTDALKMERSAYFGGRCEAYRLGRIDGKVYHLDVRNMYPSLCLDLQVPISLRRYYGDGESATRIGQTRPESLIAHVRVKSPVPTYPLRRRGDIIYPIGEYTTWLCGPELTGAVKEGRVTRWHSAAEYTCATALRSYYARWIDLLSSARASGRMLLTTYIKRVMNALVGKFGEPGRRWVEAPPAAEQGPYVYFGGTGPDGEPCHMRNIGWYTQREEVNGESYWSIPAIAAWITAAGRARLWNYLVDAGRANVWYVDTDSIICNEVGYLQLLRCGHVRDGEIGYLRLVEESDGCTIHGIRHYETSQGIVCAGVPRGDIRPGETRGQYWWRRTGKSEIALGSAPTGGEQLIHAPAPEEYHHGQVMPDGRVIPWEMGGK